MSLRMALRTQEILRRATLIQNIANFRLVMESPIFAAMQQLGITTVPMKKALKWIISEELELCHGMFDRQHVHNHADCLQIWQCADTILHDTSGKSLSKVFCSWIACPRVYDDHNQLDVVLVGNDLYFFYETAAVEPMLYPLRTPSSF